MLAVRRRILMEKDFLFTEEHNNNLPTVRIKRAELNNFKSVRHGEIVMDCGKQFIPYGTQSDILGLYGQNGSGKTALIEALAILKMLMSGESVPDVYTDCLSINDEPSRLSFAFDLQYKDGQIRELEYSFNLKRVKLTKDEMQERDKDITEDCEQTDRYKVLVFDEIVKLSGDYNGKKNSKQIIIDTSTKNAPFGSAPKLKAFIGKNRNAIFELEVNKKLTAEKSKSFIFNTKTLQIFKDSELYSVYFMVLLEMRYFASMYFSVVDTKSSGFIRFNFALPLYSRLGVRTMHTQRPLNFSNEEFEYFNEIMNTMSEVLCQLVPGLKIKLKKITDIFTKKGEPGCMAELVSYRDGKELPLRDESDGVRKIISILSLIINAYNEQSFTLAVDEFDAGIFEYLLGEILQTFEESGKGQFIFTSHNLRPLEVINKKFLVFTTTNPDNRYFRLKNISATNNLRDVYFREIILGEQEEQIYSKTKRFKIAAAMKQAKMPV